MSSENPIYAQRIDHKRGCREYIVTVFHDNGNSIDVVVSELFYETLEELAKQDRRISRQIERHNEYSELTDESLYNRACFKPKPIEDVVIDALLAEQVVAIVKTLPPLQVRRFVLRNILGLTYPQIASLEGCSARAVKGSVDRATEKIRRILNL